MKPETKQKLLDVTEKMQKVSSELDAKKEEHELLRKEFLQLCTQAITEDRPFEKEPRMAKFSFVNDKLGKVYGRTRAESSSYDIDALRKDPLLKDVVVETTVYDVDEDMLNELMNADPALVAKIQKEFIKQKKSTIRLSPVRDISPEDL